VTEHYRVSKAFELNNPYPIFDGEAPLTQKEVANLLNQYEYETQTLKQKVTELLTETMTITDLSDKQRINELTNYALVQFIKSKGHTMEEVTAFVKEKL
jgi:hypothetical protein